MTLLRASFPQPTVVTSDADLDRYFPGQGVTMADASLVTFEGSIQMGRAVELSGECQLLDGTEIHSGSHLKNAKLGRRNAVRAYSLIFDATIGDGNILGPFCFVRDGCRIGDNCIIGSHVETARSVFASGVKVSHQAFIGDARIEGDTIIGAGTVFCNFDGAGRQPTTIGKGVTVGSGSLLVPPLSIGDGALIAAGSVVTKDVAPGSKIIQKRKPV